MLEVDLHGDIPAAGHDRDPLALQRLEESIQVELGPEILAIRAIRSRLTNRQLSLTPLAHVSLPTLGLSRRNERRGLATGLGQQPIDGNFLRPNLGLKLWIVRPRTALRLQRIESLDLQHDLVGEFDRSDNLCQCTDRIRLGRVQLGLVLLLLLDDLFELQLNRGRGRDTRNANREDANNRLAILLGVHRDKLVLELFAPTADGSIDRTSDVTVPVDGDLRTLNAGGFLKLDPGESVTLMPGIWHAFWGEGADVLIGEVSTVNDDKTDNIFEMNIGRFATVEEDEAPVHLLVSDYDAYL